VAPAAPRTFRNKEVGRNINECPPVHPAARLAKPSEGAQITASAR
jgi:hypothetical protein